MFIFGAEAFSVLFLFWALSSFPRTLDCKEAVLLGRAVRSYAAAIEENDDAVGNIKGDNVDGVIVGNDDDVNLVPGEEERGPWERVLRDDVAEVNGDNVDGDGVHNDDDNAVDVELEFVPHSWQDREHCVFMWSYFSQ